MERVQKIWMSNFVPQSPLDLSAPRSAKLIPLLPFLTTPPPLTEYKLMVCDWYQLVHGLTLTSHKLLSDQRDSLDPAGKQACSV